MEQNITFRPKMDDELQAIDNKVLSMAELVETQILNAVKAIKEKDMKLARDIIDGDEEIDDLEDKINNDCFKFLATQAPLASDLRYAISIMKMIRDIERIGDHCVDIAKFAIRLNDKEYYKELIDLPRMAGMSTQMVSDAIRSFVDKDLRLARRVWKKDDEIDELYKFVLEEQLGVAGSEPEKAECAVQFAFVAEHLERIADYATNICEETVFMLEGKDLTKI
ncbi:MAG: phosphate signaling complex protein PhoU [Eubacteriaceae bacterium]|jgi:phosphate transport system protein|nr:phosphate signaling complex protein PhoU [Eubacteriaceae bacterium]